jgi:hypothetical protein
LTISLVSAPGTTSLPRPHLCALSPLTTTLRATRNPGGLSRLAASIARDGRRDVTPDQRAELDGAVTELIRYLPRLRKGLR